MEKQKFESIVETIHNFQGLSKNCLIYLKRIYPDVPHKTLSSILSLEYQNLMKLTYSKSPKYVEKYVTEFLESVQNREKPGVIVRMAKRHNIAPCLIAKLILQYYLEGSKDSELDFEGYQLKLNSYMSNTCLIPDMNLAYEIYLCTIYDDQYSPLVEVMKTSVGQEYEGYLERTLTERGIAFRNENYLRRFRYDKTPDIKLEIPLSINGLVINWVESKALFGNEDVHDDYFRNQYISYWNRFGPGLIIYWFGFVKTITKSYNKMFIIKDHFPEEAVK